ncbi:MAG: methylmalonyl-CoA mutase family protein [Balneolaceae bacterium]
MLQSNLFDEFPRISREEWENRIEQDLKLEDEDYKAHLKWESPEGFEVLPFYMREDLEPGEVSHLRAAPGTYPFTRGAKRTGNWLIAERVDANDPAKARQTMRRLLERDVDLIQFKLQATPDEGMLGGDLTGLNIQSPDEFEKFIEGLNLKNTGFIVDSGMTSPAVFTLMNSVGQIPADRQTFFTFDPFTFTARSGRKPLPENELRSLIRQFGSQPVRSLSADGLFYHRCGASLVQELGISLAIGSEYFAVALAEEENPETVCQAFWMRLSAGSLYFPEIAKFRAARMLWSKVTEAYGLGAESAKALHIHVETSPWNQTVYEPYSNMLRATTETMSAALGGADSILTLPFNAANQSSDPFSSRIARNIHHILKNESFLHKVADPSAGSWYVEQLTDQIAEKAWSFFQMIEKQGGVMKALEAGTLQSAVQESRNRKIRDLAHRNIISLGTNHYPDPEESPGPLFQEKPTHTLRKTESDPDIDSVNLIHSLHQAFQAGALLGDVIRLCLTPQKQILRPISAGRLTLPFEQLRKATDDYHQKHGKKPTVLLLPVGNKKVRNARAQFSRNVFGCAGYKIYENTGYDTLQQGLDDTRFLQADIVVLCSSDEVYPELAEPFCEAYKNTGTLRILAGKPNDNKKYYRKSGIKYFIHSNTNILEFLSRIHQELGILDKTIR